MKCHVLLVITGYPPDHSGSGKRIHQLYQRLQRLDDGFSWSVLSRGGEHSILGPEKYTGIPKREGWRQILWELFYPFLFVLRGGFNKVDLIHSAGWSWFTLSTLFLAYLWRIPILREMTTTGDVGGKKSLGQRLIALSNRLAKAGIAISPGLARQARAAGWYQPIWTRVNGVDGTVFRLPNQTERTQAKARLTTYFPQYDQKDILLLHVGRLRPLKNQHFLVNLMQKMPHHFRLLLIGPPFSSDDRYYQNLQQQIIDLNLKERVVLIAENREDVASFMWGADLFLFPSTEEGLGNVMLEALMCGLPVVAHNIKEVTDWIITPGENGALASLKWDVFQAKIITTLPLLSKREVIAKKSRERFDHLSLDQKYLQRFYKYRRS
ncbi:glycosyltransferase family 4 protein [Magnetococcales bacterium HHB-1]